MIDCNGIARFYRNIQYVWFLHIDTYIPFFLVLITFPHQCPSTNFIVTRCVKRKAVEKVCVCVLSQSVCEREKCMTEKSAEYTIHQIWGRTGHRIIGVCFLHHFFCVSLTLNAWKERNKCVGGTTRQTGPAGPSTKKTNELAAVRWAGGGDRPVRPTFCFKSNKLTSPWITIFPAFTLHLGYYCIYLFLGPLNILSLLSCVFFPLLQRLSHSSFGCEYMRTRVTLRICVFLFAFQMR